MVGSATADQQKPSAPSDLRHERLDSTQDDAFRLKVDPAPHGVHHGLRLLADLLLHERREAALHDLLDLHLEGDNLSTFRSFHLDAPADPVDGEGARVAHGGHVVVLEVDHPVGVLHDGAGVAGEEVLGHVVLAQGGELGPAGVPAQAEHGIVPPPLPAVVDGDVVGGQLVLGKDANQQG